MTWLFPRPPLVGISRGCEMPAALYKSYTETAASSSLPINLTEISVENKNPRRMGRGVSSGGGQSSLGYLFGGGEAPKPSPAAANNNAEPVQDTAPPLVDNTTKQTPAGIPGNHANNYFRGDGQNTGNFITERPSTKVHSAPGGGSSLGYLFGGN